MNIRASGVLMHITSLPGDYGIGSFGQAQVMEIHLTNHSQQ